MIAHIPRASTARPALIVDLAVLLLALAMLPWCGIGATTCAIALAAMLKAEREGRPAAMLVATGIAVGSAPGGLLIVPIALGVSIRRGSWPFAAFAAFLGATVGYGLGNWTADDTLPNLAVLALRKPDLIALIAAIATGTAVYIAADASSRRLPARDILTGTIALACFVPTPPVVALAFVLVLLPELMQSTPPRAANDDPILPPLRLRVSV